MAGKVAWVIGAGSGVGQACAVSLAEAGATVVVSGRRANALAETAKPFPDAIEAVAVDIADPNDVATAHAAILARHGKVDILVNSAGQNIPARTWAELSVEDWDRLMAVNASGAFYAMRAVLPGMRQRQDGLIINIASWGSLFPLRFAGAAYTASKTAMLALTRTLNMEEGAHGIRACAVLPAAIATDMLRKRATAFSDDEIAAMLRPDDVARVVRFVAETPAAVVLNEIVVSPTRNLIYERSA